MTNCPAPDWRVAGRGIRLSCGWDWAETKGERKDITIRTAHPCRILTRSPRLYFTANLARRGRCALFLLSDLGFCKQQCREGRGKPVRECLRSVPCDPGVEAAKAAATILQGLSNIRSSFRVVSLNVPDYVVEVLSG